VICRLIWIACVLGLRFLAPQPPPLVPSADAPPPPIEDRLAVADDARDDGADDPADVDDDDDDDDDVALPTAIPHAEPPAADVRPSWSLLLLADRDGCDRLFRPPRHA
jgi:hypothetical protein